MRGVIQALLVAMLLVTACGQDDTVGVATATAEHSAVSGLPATATPAATDTPSPSPSPTPEARAPEIAEFNVIRGDFGNTLMVRLHNPNDGVGLIRTGFELTAVADDGAIIDVYGTDGLPGASCCTIYRLPPGGDFGLWIQMDQGAADPATIELAVTGRWVDWSTVEAPESVLSDLTVNQTEFAGPQLTGRVTTPGAAADGPFNVWVVGFVDSPTGLIVIADSVDCVATGDARAFAIDSFIIGAVQGPYTLVNAVGYTTTVPGVTEPAPGC